MTKKTVGGLLGLAGLVLVLGAVCWTIVGPRPDEAPATEQRKIAFSDLRHQGRDFADKAYPLDPARALDAPMVLQTRTAALLDLGNGARSTVNLASFRDGVAACTFSCAAGSFRPNNVEIEFPTFYVEEQAAETLVIPLAGGSGPVSLTVRDSREVFPDAASAVLVEFTAADAAVLPYNPTLVSNGTAYECTPSYLFDSKTGAFTSGQLVYSGITVGELAADAALETARTLNQYVPAAFDLAQ